MTRGFKLLLLVVCMGLIVGTVNWQQATHSRRSTLTTTATHNSSKPTPAPTTPPPTTPTPTTPPPTTPPPTTPPTTPPPTIPPSPLHFRKQELDSTALQRCHYDDLALKCLTINGPSNVQPKVSIVSESTDTGISIVMETEDEYSGSEFLGVLQTAAGFTSDGYLPHLFHSDRDMVFSTSYDLCNGTYTFWFPVPILNTKLRLIIYRTSACGLGLAKYAEQCNLELLKTVIPENLVPMENTWFVSVYDQEVEFKLDLNSHAQRYDAIKKLPVCSAKKHHNVFEGYWESSNCLPGCRQLASESRDPEERQKSLHDVRPLTLPPFWQGQRDPHVWQPLDCRMIYYSSYDLQTCLNKLEKSIVFVGDSLSEHLYHIFDMLYHDCPNEDVLCRDSHDYSFETDTTFARFTDGLGMIKMYQYSMSTAHTCKFQSSSGFPGYLDMQRGFTGLDTLELSASKEILENGNAIFVINQGIHYQGRFATVEHFAKDYEDLILHLQKAPNSQIICRGANPSLGLSNGASQMKRLNMIAQDICKKHGLPWIDHHSLYLPRYDHYVDEVHVWKMGRGHDVVNEDASLALMNYLCNDLII